MKLLALSTVLLAGLGAGTDAPARPHRITLEGADGEYRMVPDEIEAGAGDTLVFLIKTGGPHALGIDPTGMNAAAREAWNRALPRRVGVLRGPLLRNDDTYQVVIPRGIPNGKYRIFCSPHRAYDEDLTIDLK